MTSIQKAVRNLLIAVLLGAAFAAPSQAALIEVSPSTQTVAPGDTVSVDIVLSGLTANETVGGFSLVLGFDPSILGAPRAYANDPGGVMGPVPLDLSGGFGALSLDLFYLADASLTEAALKAAEGTGFTLAHVTFTAAAEGLSLLTLSVSPSTGVFLSDYSGVNEIPASAKNGQVCVSRPGGVECGSTAPEPGTLALLAIAVLGLAWGRRRHIA